MQHFSTTFASTLTVNKWCHVMKFFYSDFCFLDLLIYLNYHSKSTNYKYPAYICSLSHTWWHFFLCKREPLKELGEGEDLCKYCRVTLKAINGLIRRLRVSVRDNSHKVRPWHRRPFMYILNMRCDKEENPNDLNWFKCQEASAMSCLILLHQRPQSKWLSRA